METNSTVENLIKRSADFSNIGDALDACIEFIENHQDDPRLLDIQATTSIIQTVLNLFDLNNGKLPDFKGKTIYQNNFDRKDLLGSGVVDVLANVIITSDKIIDKGKRENAKQFLLAIQALGATQLLKFYNSAQNELESLLVEGKARSLAEGVTLEDAYNDAEIYYNAYLEGDIEGAFRGMNYLKSLNPYDSYFRNFMGVLFDKKAEHEKAIQEFLMGIKLNPEDSKTMCNLMNQLSLISLHPLVLEFWTYYKIKGKPDEDSSANADIQRMVTVSKICTMGMISDCLKITEEDISSSETSLFDELEIAERPWFKNSN